MIRRIWTFAFASWQILSAYAAVAQSDVESLLNREILDRATPLSEVQTFVESRVPLMKSYAASDQWNSEADKMRQEVLEKVVYRGQAVKWRDARTSVQWLETIPGGPGYTIRKLRYEALPGMWIPALLYLPDKISGHVPAVLNVNGHSPEGKQYPPKQMRCINLAKRGMLALNIEWLGMGQLRTSGYSHTKMNQLDLCGTSGLAPFYLCMKRGLDVLLSLEHADPARVCVTGLSGGGWQTIVLSALDTRVTLCNPVAGYSSFLTRTRHFKDLGDSEQTPTDLATIADYTHLTAMLAPRPALLTYNAKDDCCFESGYALQPLIDAASGVYRLFDKPNFLRSHVNHDPGTHNFEVDNRQALYRMMGDYFYTSADNFNRHEIPSNDELKTAEQLMVGLPSTNEDFHTLAVSISESMPKYAITDNSELRARLKDVVKAKEYSVAATQVGRDTKGDVTAIYWQLRLGNQWTVPAVELLPSNVIGTAILIADGGRTAAAAQAADLVQRGNRVLAVDPFYFGESKIREKDWLFALLVATVGERPLGVQASQIAAIARWTKGRAANAPVTLVSAGPRSGVIALVAAAIERQSISNVVQHDALESLKEVIARDMSITEAPELFCFGLLELCDLKQLRAVFSH